MPIVVPYPEHEATLVSAQELAFNRRLTDKFIAYDPIDLSLTRYTKTPQADGGFKYTSPVSIAAQTFRLIPASDRAPEAATSSGRMVTPEYVLLGLWDANMERFDSFLFAGVEYEIAFIRPAHTSENRYETKGDVVRRG
jgi:hypothetical protein